MGISVRLKMTDFCIENRILWCVPQDFNGLFQVNLEDDKVNFLGCIPQEKLFGTFLYGSPEKYGDLLVFPPMSAEEIVFYDLETGVFNKIPLMPSIHYVRNDFKLSSSVKYKDYIYLIPEEYGAIIEVDSKNKNIRYITDWYEEIWNKDKPIVQISRYSEEKGVDKIWFLLNQYNNENREFEDTLLGVFNLRNKQIKQFELDQRERVYTAIALNDKAVVMAGITEKKVHIRIQERENGKIYHYDTDDIKVYRENVDLLILGIFFMENEAIVWLQNFEYIIVCELETMQMRMEKIPYSMEEILNDSICIDQRRWNVVKKINNVIYFQDGCSDILYEWNYFQNIVRKHLLIIDTDDLSEELRNHLYDFVKEGRFGIDIKQFVQHLDKREKEQQSNGLKIYEALKR